MGELYARQMAQQDAVRMQGPFGLTGRARGKNNDRRVIRRRLDRCEPIRGPRQSIMKINSPLQGAINTEYHPQFRQLIPDRQNFRQACRIRDHRPRPTTGQAIFQRLFPKQDKQRHRDKPGLIGGNVRNSGFRGLGQQDSHAVFPLQALSDQDICEAVAEPG